MGEIQNENSTTNGAAFLAHAQSVIQSRAALSGLLGKAFGGERDYYDVLGYTLNPTVDHYRSRYERQDIASRIVNAYPDETWRLWPSVWERKEEQATAFEVSWNRIAEQFKCYHYFHRLDRLVGLGRYGLLLLGFDDSGGLDQAVSPGGRRVLRYLSLYSEEHAAIDQLDADGRSQRFGLPNRYRIDLSRSTNLTSNRNRNRVSRGTGNATQEVHFSRVLHVADGLTEDDVYGTPRLRPVLNLLDDLQKLIGGSAEAFWRSSSRDLIATVRDNAHLTPADEATYSEQLDEYVHGLRRILKLQGIDVEAITPETASPREAVDVVIEMMSATTGIPKRILTGSERGELASSQDASNWIARVEQRQKQFAEPVIIRPFIDRLIQMRVLPTPPDGYFVEWPSLFPEDEGARADRIDKFASALAKIAGPGQVLTTFPLREIREQVLEWDPVSPYDTDEQDAFDEEGDDDDV